MLLTKSYAEAYVDDPSSVTLSQFTELEDTAAAILSRCELPLYLDGVEILSAKSAKHLQQHKGGFLSLDSLHVLSPWAAHSLSLYSGDLSVGCLYSASLSGAILRARGGSLVLDESEQVTMLTDEEAEWLRSYNEDVLWLDGLTQVSDAGLGSLSCHAGTCLSLNGLKDLTPGAAHSLSKYQGDLYLDGLTSLPESVADALARQSGQKLTLNGVTGLTDAAAMRLSERKKHLLNTPSVLALRSLADLSLVAAEHLACFAGQVDVSAEKLDAYLVDIIRKKVLTATFVKRMIVGQSEKPVWEREPVNLAGFRQLQDSAAQAIVESGHPAWFLDCIEELSDGTVEILCQLRGDLRLNGLLILSDSAANSLSKHRHNLFLNGLTSLTDAAAESLSRHRGQKIVLRGITHLSQAAIRSLGRYEGKLCIDQRFRQC
ncbi:MAG: hypothetical protein RLZZ436_2080 [Planctomycetota bacterium]